MGLAITLDHILLNSCHNFEYDEFGNKTGWSEFTIETHCLLYTIIAKLNDDQETYTIKSYTVKDC